ncbi:DgyrCDS5646 [Dimorphilus gyrociliatus]|uniref:Delta-like protein n=1 Tax=Dimorphilus gyrociliatus TaxID=2664684 RepID=A0A7I8VKL3_9ANNE|nr:DgyrCDS5646 [Dimorphilus gyrociliatus]
MILTKDFGTLWIAQAKIVADFYVNLIQWQGNSREHDGDVCDGGAFITGSKKKCDPIFQVCFSKLSENKKTCSLGRKTTSEQNNRYKVTRFSGLQPYKIQVRDKYQGGVVVDIDVHDHDSYNNDDLVDRFHFDLKTAANGEKRKSSFRGKYYYNTRNTIELEFWVKCRTNYYHTDCSVFCKRERNSNFDCDSKTGKKLCHAGWIGENCEQDIKECDSNPCLNGGTCYEPQKAMFECACTDQFVGKTCESHVCDLQNPCLNNGTCVENLKCSCPRVYTGDKCQTHVCDAKSCLNGAVCNRTNGMCICSKAYFGELCEKDACKDKNELGHPYVPCVHGVCKEGSCICIFGFGGTYCNIPISTSPNSANSFAPNQKEKLYKNESSVISKHCLIVYRRRQARKLPQEQVQNQANLNREHFDVDVINACNPVFDADGACSAGPNGIGGGGACSTNFYSDAPKALEAMGENPYAEVAECKLRSLQSQIDDPNVYAVLPSSSLPPPLPSRQFSTTPLSPNVEAYQSPNVLRLPTYDDDGPPPPYSLEKPTTDA